MSIGISQIKKLPDTPGVYLFKSGNKILYIGKATSLRDRVRSYFSPDLIATRGMLLVDMVAKATKIDFVKTNSVLEALILEAELIKKYQPKYNSKEKDDKSFNCVIITNEDFPQVLIIRKKDIDLKISDDSFKKNIKYIFGPFPNGGQLKEALKIIRKIFPWRDQRCSPKQSKQCFNRQIGLCPGVCTGEISKKDYAKTIKHLKLFFEGKNQALFGELEKEMKVCAKKEEFEKANKIKKTIFSLNHIQDVALIKHEMSTVNSEEEKPFRIEGYDVAHTSGRETVGVMVVSENIEIKKSDYRMFKIRGNLGINDTASLKEVLKRRLNHPEWQYPDLIVIDGGPAQFNTANTVIKEFEKSFIKTPIVVSIVKDERHKPKDILGNKEIIDIYKKDILLINSEAHRFAIQYHKKLRGKAFGV
ncbi:MAG: GIY-YIG nuclease family protein [Candidatus Paceibacterota bacterium]